MIPMKQILAVTVLGSALVAPAAVAGQNAPAVAAPPDVKPGSITCEDVQYPYPSSYLPLTLYGQDVRLAYLDVPALGTPNGHTVVLEAPDKTYPPLIAFLEEGIASK